MTTEDEKRKAQGTQLEFGAKRINDQLTKVLADAFPGRELGFMSFVFDMGDSGYIGYLASTRRVDAFRVISEWMERSFDGFSREQLLELIKEYEKELAEVEKGNGG